MKISAINVKRGDVVLGYGEVVNVTVDTHDVANVGKVGHQDLGTLVKRGNMSGPVFSAVLISLAVEDEYRQEPRSVNVEFLYNGTTIFEPEQKLELVGVPMELAKAA